MIELTAEQKAAIEKIDQSMLVTAGAGSGKTLVLVRRFVEILEKQPQLSVKNVLAVTYTRKAAREMRTRIKSRLKELYDETQHNETQNNEETPNKNIGNNGVNNTKRNWQQSLSEMDTAHIETIHSLCQTILRNFAIHAGVGVNIDLLEEIEQAQIIEETIEEALRQAIALREDDYLFITNFSPADISDILRTVLRNHLQFSQLADQMKKLSAEDFKNELNQLLTRIQKQFLTDLLLDEQWRNAAKYVQTTPYPDPGSELEAIRKTVSSLAHSLTSNNWKTVSSLAHSLTNNNWQILLDLSVIDKPGNRGGRSPAAIELRKQINILIDKARDLATKLPLFIEPKPPNPDTATRPEAAATPYVGARFIEPGLTRLDIETKSAEPTQNITDYWRLWQSFLFMAHRALDIYKDKKQQLQKLDYDDLIVKTSTILNQKDSPVHNHYKNTFSHILVDEFQDTNSVQVGLIKMLAGAETKLFFIGDDKQSIYKFQGADLATFNALRKEMNDDTAFEYSFRSTPTIVSFVNDIFSRLLHADLAHVDYRAKYRPLKAKRDLLGAPKITHEMNHKTNNVELIQLPVIDRKFQQPNMPPERIIEGMAVANWIKAKVEQEAPVLDKNGNSRPINYNDFAILVPNNNDFSDLESCLSQYGIPYVTSGGKTFLQRQEIYDLENMLLFLSNPSDSHALFGVLRSPMFAITDDLIHQLAAGNNLIASTEGPAAFSTAIGAQHARPYSSCPCSLWQSLQDQAERKLPGFELINEAVMILKRLLAEVHILNLSQLIYKVIRDTNYDLTVLNSPDGKQRYKNIWKFYSLAAQKEELTANEFTQHLDLSRQLSVDLSNAPVDNGHSVRLMTIHAAKGLEFPAVALPRLSAKGRIKENKLLFHYQFGIAINTARGSFSTVQEKEQNTPLSYAVSRVLNQDMEIAEKKRLLYVAMTRARDYLGVFIKESDRKGEHAANWLRPLLDQLVPSLYSKGEPVGPMVKWENSEVKNISARNDNEPLELLTPIYDHLLEPHTGASVSSQEAEFISRITPVSGADIEPEHSLTGAYFHKIMEFLPQGKITLPEDELYALIGQMDEGKTTQAVHPQIARTLVDQGKKLLAIFVDSKLQSLMSTAKTICHEWSYYRTESGKRDPKRRPDLLLEAEDGTWYVIDYKTDNFPMANIKQQALQHSLQLERYGEDLTALTGIKPKLAIYFAQHGILHELAHSVCLS